MEAAFRCHHQSIETIIVWRVNGSSVRQFPGARAYTTHNTTDGIVDTLIIPVTIENNQTEVVCRALFPTETTPPAKLFVMRGQLQPLYFLINNAYYAGPLQSVVNLTKNASTLSEDLLSQTAMIGNKVAIHLNVYQVCDGSEKLEFSL